MGRSEERVKMQPGASQRIRGWRPCSRRRGRPREEQVLGRIKSSALDSLSVACPIRDVKVKVDWRNHSEKGRGACLNSSPVATVSEPAKETQGGTRMSGRNPGGGGSMAEGREFKKQTNKQKKQDI